MTNQQSSLSGYTDAELENLKFRRQFLLGPFPYHVASNWRRLSVGPGIHLSAHPDLDLNQVERNGKSIILIGYLLDPNKPSATNSEILHSLIQLLESCDRFFRFTNEFGGRWLLIVCDGDRSILFGDATGQRQVCYSLCAATQKILCATQPGLIARELGLTMDPEALEYMATRGDDDTDVYWMPGDTTLYREIRALLPNHYLDLSTGQARRYWPDVDIGRRSLDDAVLESQRIMRGLMQSASLRYPLAVAMTAGWDSRLMLALSRDLIRDMYCFTLAYPHLSEDSRDVVIPKRLLAKLGIAHEVIRFPAVVDARFKTIYKANNASANAAYSADGQAMHDRYPVGRVCVTGDIAEVVKCYYRPSDELAPLSAELLADLCKLGRHTFVLKALESWLSGASSRNISVLDLFCWEQTAGRWQALIRSEYDMVQESFSPFNCRTLLTTLLETEERHRAPPKFMVLNRLIASLWPEVLTVPINPPERLKFKRLAVKILRSVGVYDAFPRGLRNIGRRLLS